MAKYKCTHVTVPGNKKCTRQPDGYARVGGKDFLMCKKHANENGYSLRSFNQKELQELGIVSKDSSSSRPTSIFASKPKDKKKK